MHNRACAIDPSTPTAAVTGAGGNPTQQQAPGSPTDTTASGFTIAYADEHLLVVDKPAGLVVHPARGHRQGTLAQLLGAAAAGGPDPQRAGIVHRLDRDTSGLLVIARSHEAHRRLQRALAERRIVREYLALVHGCPPARTGTIEAPIGRDPRVRTRMAVAGAHPREARTHFTIERSLGPFTLLRLRLDTGRTHQIRVHLQAIGHPVAGDHEYGRSPRREDSVSGPDGAGALELRRQFLHAARLSFAHPFTGVPIDVASPLPADLQAALTQAKQLS
jgi:23S rRNA pseudouridine1911/1915/1917 synthase